VAAAQCGRNDPVGGALKPSKLLIGPPSSAFLHDRWLGSSCCWPFLTTPPVWPSMTEPTECKRELLDGIIAGAASPGIVHRPWPWTERRHHPPPIRTRFERKTIGSSSCRSPLRMPSAKTALLVIRYDTLLLASGRGLGCGIGVSAIDTHAFLPCAPRQGHSGAGVFSKLVDRHGQPCRQLRRAWVETTPSAFRNRGPMSSTYKGLGGAFAPAAASAADGGGWAACAAAALNWPGKADLLQGALALLELIEQGPEADLPSPPSTVMQARTALPAPGDVRLTHPSYQGA